MAHRSRSPSQYAADGTGHGPSAPPSRPRSPVVQPLDGPHAHDDAHAQRQPLVPHSAMAGNDERCMVARRPCYVVPLVAAMMLAIGPILGITGVFDVLARRGVYHDQCACTRYANRSGTVSNHTPHVTTREGQCIAPPPETCTAQHDKLEDATDLALSLANAGSLLCGVTIDLIGGKWSAFIFAVLWTVATGIAGINPSEGTVWTAATGVSALAGGGWFVSMLLHHLRYIFPRSRDYAVANPAFTALYNIASLGGVVFKHYFGWQAVGLRALYGGYAAVVGAPLIVLLALFPSTVPQFDEETTRPTQPRPHTAPGTATPAPPASTAHSRHHPGGALLQRQSSKRSETLNSSMVTVPTDHSSGASRSARLDRDDDRGHDSGWRHWLPAAWRRSSPTERNSAGAMPSHSGGGRSGSAIDGSRTPGEEDDLLTLNHPGRSPCDADDDEPAFLYESVDRRGAYGGGGGGGAGSARTPGGVRHDGGGGVAYSMRHDGRGHLSPSSGATAGLRFGRSRSATPRNALNGGVADENRRADDDEDRVMAAGRTEVLVLLKTGTDATVGPRQRAWARVRLAGSAARKIVKQPLYTAFCIHAIATVTVGYLFIACAGSLFRYVGASPSGVNEARDWVMYGIAITAPLSLVPGTALRRLGPHRGVIATACLTMVLAATYTSLFLIATTAADDGSWLSVASNRIDLLYAGMAAVLVARILSFSLLNLAVPVLFDEHALGVGLAVGSSFTVGGVTSILAGTAMSHAVHDNPGEAFTPVIASCGGFVIVAEAILIAAIIVHRRTHPVASIS
jgi:hypothetical protein